MTTPSGRAVLKVRVPGSLVLQDVSRDGTLLVTRDNIRSEIAAFATGETKERELTWLDWSLPSAISADGKTVLFAESGEGRRRRVLRLHSQDRRLAGGASR